MIIPSECGSRSCLCFSIYPKTKLRTQHKLENLVPNKKVLIMWVNRTLVTKKFHSPKTLPRHQRYKTFFLVIK